MILVVVYVAVALVLWPVCARAAMKGVLEVDPGADLFDYGCAALLGLLAAVLWPVMLPVVAMAAHLQKEGAPR